MVNYRQKLNLDFDPSPLQIKIIEHSGDTVVRALPGSGKTTVLKMKIQNLLIDKPNLTRMVCISYTNVNVIDLEDSCKETLNEDQLRKLEFLTFHSFCLKYIIEPFGYLFHSKKSMRAYRKIFDFVEHGSQLFEYVSSRLGQKNIDDIKALDKAKKEEKIGYTFDWDGKKWTPVAHQGYDRVLVPYFNFLSENMLIDFNLACYLSMEIIKANRFVARVLNKALDWIFIDEFQDVSSIQCELMKEILKARCSKREELRWFLVGDPNQSIYRFAGANPMSMFEIRNFLNLLNINSECEFRLEETFRCTNKVFSFARENYNKWIEAIIACSESNPAISKPVRDYIDDLKISNTFLGTDKIDDCSYEDADYFRSFTKLDTITSQDLLYQRICCIGVNRVHNWNVITVLRTYYDSKNAGDYGSLRRCVENLDDEFKCNYGSIFIKTLSLRDSYFRNPTKVNTIINLLKKEIRILFTSTNLEVYTPELARQVISSVVCLSAPIYRCNSIADEFETFFIRLKNAILHLPIKSSNHGEKLLKSIEIKDSKNKNIYTNSKLGDLINSIRSPYYQGEIEVQHVNRVKGLEYDHTIIHGFEEIPHKPEKNPVAQAIREQSKANFSENDLLDYVQDLNKLYVMLTRSKKSLKIIRPDSKTSLLTS